jgi:RNA polymerase sigma-70 factor (ECF subfamily)
MCSEQAKCFTSSLAVPTGVFVAGPDVYFGLAVGLTEEELQKLRLKLRCKVRYHVGGFCADVEDIVQESLARFLRAEQARTIEHPENLGGFLNGICNNVIAEYRRHLFRDGPLFDEPPERASPGISHAEALELRNAVETVLAGLSDRDRRVLAGLYIEGKTPQEVYLENGISADHLKVVLFRAKARFRKLYLHAVKPDASGSHLATDV